MNRRRVAIGLLAGYVAAAVGLSAYLALTRIYQVDECQNLYMARVLATGQVHEYFTNGSLFLFGPLGWISRGFARSADSLTAARVLSLGLFWFNLVLLARISCRRLFSLRGLIALAAAATLAPLWDYGFEIRHDNLVLAGVLVMWFLLRTMPMGLRSYALASAVAVAMLFVAVKAVVYVVPVGLLAMAFPAAAHGRPRWQLALAGTAGALFALAIIRLCYGSGGGWQVYLTLFHGVSKYSAGGGGGSPRFWPWLLGEHLLTEAPLLLALTLAAIIDAGADLLRRGRAAWTWDGKLPEVYLVGTALFGLAANPTPYPYNMVHLVPYFFLLAFRFAWEFVERTTSAHSEVSSPNLAASSGAVAMRSPTIATFAMCVLVFAHLTPFAVATARHWQYPNARQKAVAGAAENLTDPATDPVYDGIGMVVTRPSINFRWYLHGLNIREFLDQPGLRLREMLAARPAAVFIPSYRTDWVMEADPTNRVFVQDRYVPVADDLWVLGKVLPPGGGTVEVFHPGRYRISSLADADILDTRTNKLGQAPTGAASPFAAMLDGAVLSNAVVQLTPGVHRIETATSQQPAMVWVGPHLDRPPPLGPGSHDTLFVNWY